MAQHLALGWLKAGYTVQFGSRQPQAKTDILNQVPCATITSNETALRVSEIVVIALRFIAVKSFAEQHADLLRNARVLDGMSHSLWNSLETAAMVSIAFHGSYWGEL